MFRELPVAVGRIYLFRLLSRSRLTCQTMPMRIGKHQLLVGKNSPQDETQTLHKDGEAFNLLCSQDLPEHGLHN